MVIQLLAVNTGYIWLTKTVAPLTRQWFKNSCFKPKDMLKIYHLPSAVNKAVVSQSLSVWGNILQFLN
jgi:hypothetical protein